MEEQEQQYKNGFNNGYLIAAYEPELYSTLIKGLNSKNEYLEGLISGGKEYEIKKGILNKLPDNKERDRMIDREK